MIRSLNQQAFRAYGTILTEKVHNQRYTNHHSISLSANTTSLYQSVADTWLTSEKGSAVLSVSLDNVTYEDFYLDRPVQLRGGIWFCLTSLGNHASVELSAFSMPADAAQGQRISALVTVTANAPMQGVLRIFDGETPVYEAPAQVIEGVNTLTVGLTAADAGAHVYRAEYAPDGDVIAQNNSLYALMNVRESARILLVDGTGSRIRFRRCANTA